MQFTGHGFVSTFIPDELVGTNTMHVRIRNKNLNKLQDFYVTAINETDYRITDPFDPNNLPDSINVYAVVSKNIKNDYAPNLAFKLKEIVAEDLEPESVIHVSKQHAKQKSSHKTEQLSLFDEPDNGPSLD